MSIRSTLQEIYAEKNSPDYYAAARSEILGLLPSHVERIFELGCGEGATLALLKDKGMADWTCGVDINQTALAVARNRGVDQVIQGNIEESELGIHPESYDVILCLDVLEHLVNPWKAMYVLYGMLKPGGVFVASIPNIRFIKTLLPLVFMDRWQYEESGILDRTHLRFFTYTSAVELVKSCGLEIEAVKANRSTKWPVRIASMVTLGAVDKFTAFQYLISAKKI